MVHTALETFQNLEVVLYKSASKLLPTCEGLCIPYILGALPCLPLLLLQLKKIDKNL